MQQVGFRNWEQRDTESLVRYANNPNIAANMTNAFPSPYGLENAQKFLEMAWSHNPTRLFAIDVNGEAIGGIGIHPQNDVLCLNAEIGYWIGEPHWGKGYVARVIPGILEYAFENFEIDRVYARCFGSNLASKRVLEKTGFELEAEFVATIFKNGRKLNELIFAKRRKPNP